MKPNTNKTIRIAALTAGFALALTVAGVDDEPDAAEELELLLEEPLVPVPAPAPAPDPDVELPPLVELVVLLVLVLDCFIARSLKAEKVLLPEVGLNGQQLASSNYCIRREMKPTH